MAWRVSLIACAVACMLAPPAMANTPRGVNLVATARVKAALRVSLLRSFSTSEGRKINGPLKGSVYYGRVGNRYYALATFSFPQTDTTDQPELFVRTDRQAWRNPGVIGGDDFDCTSPGGTYPPRALMHDAWYLC